MNIAEYCSRDSWGEYLTTAAILGGVKIVIFQLFNLKSNQSYRKFHPKSKGEVAIQKIVASTFNSPYIRGN